MEIKKVYLVIRAHANSTLLSILHDLSVSEFISMVQDGLGFESVVGIFTERSEAEQKALEELKRAK